MFEEYLSNFTKVCKRGFNFNLHSTSWKWSCWLWVPNSEAGICRLWTSKTARISVSHSGCGAPAGDFTGSRPPIGGKLLTTSRQNQTCWNFTLRPTNLRTKHKWITHTAAHFLTQPLNPLSHNRQLGWSQDISPPSSQTAGLLNKATVPFPPTFVCFFQWQAVELGFGTSLIWLQRFWGVICSLRLGSNWQAKKTVSPQ